MADLNQFPVDEGSAEEVRTSPFSQGAAQKAGHGVEGTQHHPGAREELLATGGSEAGTQSNLPACEQKLIKTVSSSLHSASLAAEEMGGRPGARAEPQWLRKARMTTG
ncbi:hypothetical protein NDU88_000571 [Pleurodeles waltl]|uniref:Uncharacterized protein n=1 Tax=Pleurodeles waltl TaxID=8319 RepID=A0AAV7V8D1_PLEWA|nr:hypothetical protein NDU88_000571 [Pleurodeles waltl]